MNQFRELQKDRGQRPRSKYGNTKTKVDDILFDSKKEAMRYAELKTMEKAGLISGLERQKRFELQPRFRRHGKTYRAIYYYADFTYYDETPNGEISGDLTRWVVEDVKSPATRRNATYKLKKKMMAYVHGIEIKEI